MSGSPTKRFGLFQGFLKKGKVKELRDKMSKLEEERKRQEQILYEFNNTLQETRENNFVVFGDMVSRFMSTHHAMSLKVQTIVASAITAIEEDFQHSSTYNRQVIELTQHISPLNDIETLLRLTISASCLSATIDKIDGAPKQILQPSKQLTPTVNMHDIGKTHSLHLNGNSMQWLKCTNWSN